MSDEERTRWEARLARERAARQEAERLLEEKSRELFLANGALRALADDLERRVEERTGELVRARDAAEQASRAKSAFLATMSHEIRTPMNGVLGMADVLAATASDPDQLEALRTIRTSGQFLIGLIDDILDLSKIEAGQLDVERAPVALVELVEDTVEALAPVAAGRSIALSLSIARDVPNGDAT